MKKHFLIIATLLLSIAINAQLLKVMTYNIRLDVAVDGENDWTHRKPFFCGQVKFYEPDFLGVQEVKPNQLTDMDSAFTDYDFIGIERDGNGKGESSNIFYKKDKFILKTQNTFWISQTPDTVSKGWDAAYNRVCTYGLFKAKKTKKHFWVFNTHLDHIGEIARTKGIELILSKISALNTKNYPVIFMGDLNSEPTTQRIIDLKNKMNDCKEISIAKPFGPIGTFNNFEHNKPVTKLIDYIFVSKNNNIIVNKYAVLSDSDNLRYPSDHFPVYVELKIN
ncbi:MAG: endonuclease/exonuclease/phosphatase family protein [Ferruginibacter sp.]|nr:endonuclease/exonuclease/phosphatase family protein [Ferruginibacter sp.]